MRKHHNKFYYQKYGFKSIFKMPYANKLYPTTDENLYRLVKKMRLFSQDDFDMNTANVAQFILDHRTQMKFRIQQKYAIFYSGESLAKQLVDKFWNDWYGSESVNPKYNQLGKNSIGCKRLPHGKFQYQIHLKKDVHQHLTNSERQNLWNFLERNEEHCMVSNKYVLDYLIGKYPHCYHGYFYVSEQKMLTPIYMIAQKGIDKVVKFVAIKNGHNKKIKK